MAVIFNRHKLVGYLRLIICTLIVIFYLKPTVDLLTFFNGLVLPLAKNHFLFVTPAGVNGQSDVSDFTTFFACGLLNKDRITASPKMDIYDPILLTQTVERLIAPMRPVEVYSIQYPPMMFALTTPLACFDIYTAWKIWFFISSLCLIAAFLFTVYRFLPDRPLLMLGLLMFFLNAPVSHNLSIGQSTSFEAAIIAITMSFLIGKNYFWAGIIAGLSLLKFQDALIILIPGICLGRTKFFYGFLWSVLIEGLLSIFVVGTDNIFNFVKTNYLCEVTHAYVGLNEIWSMSNFRGLISCLPSAMPNASILAVFCYILCAGMAIILWIKLYPPLKQYSNFAFELIGSITVTLLTYFNLHCYLYDYLLLVFPVLWLYVWSTTESSRYTQRQSFIRFLIAIFCFSLPFLFWTNSEISFTENTTLGYQLRIFSGNMILLFCAIMAVFVEFKQQKVDSTNLEK
jgi:hypothetical protein